MIRRYCGIPQDAKYGEEFMKRFPILFQERNKSMQETCMCWGIECPKGWYHILEQLCTYLEFHNIEFTKKYGIAVVADQVKEKYGTLRFYYTIHPVDDNGVLLEYGSENAKVDENTARIATDYLEATVDALINEAEDMTYTTCADCGWDISKEEDRVETSGWITYLCKECDEERRKKYEEWNKKTPEEKAAAIKESSEEPEA